MSRLTSLAFLIDGYAARQRSFEIINFLLLDGLRTKDDEPHLSEAAGTRDPPAIHLLSVRTWSASLSGLATRVCQELDLG
ncbi:hypothetical protein DPMN_036391 [Dreissena polymorpha]|uniref:Uncharacterized protein n=1 Tax=Dreissena polymorpha TaxID=45954 RepID=A0A9D4RLW0_DREPO|nr:hypothetical protein DPMN_036366 [Dreissena polymorpha]KAH3873164.1 hypothetical protein DPMN_036391 [Dreissena polymorpha]